MAFRPTLTWLRRARVTIPQLSPTHSRAKIVEFLVGTDGGAAGRYLVESYDPVCVLQCSSDLVTPGYRLHDNHEPIMLVDSQEDGILQIHDDVQLNEWYPVGKEIGVIDDGDDDDDEDGEWLWQAYSHEDTSSEDKGG